MLQLMNSFGRDEDKDLKYLFHGSPNSELIPIFGKGEDKHDYGRGFYLTEFEELAREWAVCASERGFVHSYSLDLHGLEVFDFNTVSPLAWIAELMSHRAADNSARYKKFSVQFIEKYRVNIAGYDVIRGWRADSSYFRIAKLFVRDELDYDLIPELFHLGDLENQFCLKSEKAFTHLKAIKGPYEVDSVYKQHYSQRDQIARIRMDEIINSSRNTMKKGFSYVLREENL